MSLSLLELEASCNESDYVYVQSSDHSDKDISDFVDNASVQNNLCFYSRIEIDRKVPDRSAKQRENPDECSHIPREIKTTEVRNYISVRTEKVLHRCPRSLSSSSTTSMGALCCTRSLLSSSTMNMVVLARCIQNHYHFRVRQEKKTPKQSSKVRSLSMEKLIYTFHVRTCSPPTREKISDFVQMHYATHIQLLLP